MSAADKLLSLVNLGRVVGTPHLLICPLVSELGRRKVKITCCLELLVLSPLLRGHRLVIIVDAGTVIEIFAEAFDVLHATDKSGARGVISPLPKVPAEKHSAGVARLLSRMAAVDDRLEQLADAFQHVSVAVLRLLHGGFIHVGLIQAGEILVQLGLIHRYDGVGGIVPHLGGIRVSWDRVVGHEGAEGVQRTAHVIGGVARSLPCLDFLLAQLAPVRLVVETDELTEVALPVVKDRVVDMLSVDVIDFKAVDVDAVHVLGQIVYSIIIPLVLGGRLPLPGIIWVVRLSRLPDVIGVASTY